MYDYKKLRGRIIEKCGSCESFANALGITSRCLSMKLNEQSDWKRDEIAKAIEVLDLSVDDIGDYFFNLRVLNQELQEGA